MIDFHSQGASVSGREGKGIPKEAKNKELGSGGTKGTVCVGLEP